MDELAQRDQALLRGLCQALTELGDAIADTSANDVEKWQAVSLWAKGDALDAHIDAASEFGRATRAQGATDALAEVMHDVRGGALSTLLGRLQLLDSLPRDEKGLEIVGTLARDHLAAMRRTVPGLDR